MTFLFILIALAIGFVLGRLYQWAKGQVMNGGLFGTDPAAAMHQAAADIAANTRRAEEQIRRLDQPTGRSRP